MIPELIPAGYASQGEYLLALADLVAKGTNGQISPYQPSEE